jgi:hypothetical protein
MKTIEEKTNYFFRNALITYNRANGFKNPIETADKDIKEFLELVIHKTLQEERDLIIEMLKNYDNNIDDIINKLK